MICGLCLEWEHWVLPPLSLLHSIFSIHWQELVHLHECSSRERLSVEKVPFGVNIYISFSYCEAKGMENLQTKTGMVEWNHELTWGVFF